MKTVLISGATGFLGSHIAEELLRQNFKVLALKRSTSNLWRCSEFSEKIIWINSDNLNLAEQEILKEQPEILIHAAWGGVKASDRNNWKEQEKNLSFLTSLFEIIKKSKISKIIALGSQAEYGVFEGLVDERHSCEPDTAYGAMKVSSSILLKSFAEINNIAWYWLRLFSVFGPREDKNWLIPATINNLMNNNYMSLTPCEQKYDYIFVKDLAKGIINVVVEKNNVSGIYNFSSSQSIRLKEILGFLENKIRPNHNLLKFGELPYRPKQVMDMHGNSELFFNKFNFTPEYDLYEGLNETIKYFIKTYNQE